MFSQLFTAFAADASGPRRRLPHVVALPRSPRRTAATMLLALGLMTLALAVPQGASAATAANLWVDATGGTCARQATASAYNDASACSSIQAAFTAASGGDTVIVKSGAYTSSKISVTSGSKSPAVNVQIEAGGTATVRDNEVDFKGLNGLVLDGTAGAGGYGLDISVPGNMLGINYGSSTLLQNFTIMGFKLHDNAPAASGQALWASHCSNVTVAYAEIYNIYRGDGAQISDSSGLCSNLTFDHIFMHDFSAVSGTDHQDGFQVRGGTNVTVKNSRITNLTNSGSQGWFVNPGDDLGGGNMQLINTVISNITGNAINYCSKPAVMKYNTLAGGLNTSTSIAGCGGNTTFVGNLTNASCSQVQGYHTNKGTGTYGHNVTTSSCGFASEGDSVTSNWAANFVGPLSGTATSQNFALAAGASAIDKGTTADYPPDDFDGGSRYQGLAPDAGADEYGTPGLGTSPPDTSITSGPSGSTTSTSASLTFTATKSATFECRLDAGSWASCTSPVTLNGLAIGQHTFDVRATDLAGNIDASPATATWTVTTPVDTTPPDTSLTSAPSGSTTATSASLSFTATETATFECRIDGGAWSSCSSPKAYSGLAVGAHTADVRATDTAGNVDTSPATASWTITAAADTTPPNTSITSAPSGSTTATSASLTFSATEVVTFECRMDGGAWGACTSPRTYSGLALGVHTFDVRATDLAGNTDLSPASAGWTVVASADTTAPDTSIVSGPTGSTTSTSASLAFSATEPATFECRIDGGAWGACTSPKAYSGLALGAHTFDVRATDTAGNLDLTPASRAWTVTAPADTTAPDTTITSGPAASGTGTTAALGFTASEAGSTFECRLDGGIWASCTSPKAYAAIAVGTHTFDVRATDAAGNTDASPATRSWTVTAPVDTTAPDTAITGGPAASTTETTATLSFTSTESGSTFQCRLDGGAWSACASPEGDSGLAVGAHTFDVRATDAASNVDATPATRTWTVVAPAPPPVTDTTAPDTSITSGPTTVTTSRSATFEFTATESSATFRCSLDGSRWSTCASPKDYSSLSRGKHTIRTRATDAAGNTDATPASYTWSIVRRSYGATYSFEPLSGRSSTPVQADSLEGACALVSGSNARLGVRLGGLSVRRSRSSMRISGKVPELAQDGVNARVRVSVRSHGRWHLLVSRRVHVRFDGSFRVKAPRRGGKVKVTAVARCG